MFRLTKTPKNGGKTEILVAEEDEDKILEMLCTYVATYASNGDEYTSEDFEAIKENRREGVGPYNIEVDEVDTLTDAEAVALGGNICAHCHSSDTTGEEPFMDDDGGRILREVFCNSCGRTTTEKYALVGLDR